MNKLPDWADRIPLIRAALTKITAELIDRRQVGDLFGVTPYQARDREIRALRRRLAEKNAELEPAYRKSDIR